MSQFSLREYRMLQGPEEALVRLGILDGAHVVLRAGPHDQLGLIARSHRDGEPLQVVSVVERTPGAVGLGEDQQALIVVDSPP